MTHDTGEPQEQIEDIVDESRLNALNRHGVFFKKRVLQEFQNTDGIEIIGEEVGFTFGECRVSDILARKKTGEYRELWMVIECKRAYVEHKSWYFVPEFEPYYRKTRSLGHCLEGNFRTANLLPVCSEGYELERTTSKKDASYTANQDPIFKAASQLACSYLGVINRRSGERVNDTTGKPIEEYIPVLVTNAQIFVIEAAFDKVRLEDGNMPKGVRANPCEFLILNHPMPTPTNLQVDFRSKMTPRTRRDWSNVFRESIYVVNASRIKDFLAKIQRLTSTQP